MLLPSLLFGTMAAVTTTSEACDAAWSAWNTALYTAPETAPILASLHYSMVLFDSNGAVCRQNRDYVVGGDPIFLAAVDEAAQDIDVDVGLCGEETVGSVQGQGGFGEVTVTKVVRMTSVTFPYVPTSVRQSTPLSLVCRAGRRRELDQGLGNGRSGDNHGGSGAERRRAKRGGAERRILHGRAAIVGVWGEGPRS